MSKTIISINHSIQKFFVAKIGVQPQSVFLRNQVLGQLYIYNLHCIQRKQITHRMCQSLSNRHSTLQNRYCFYSKHKIDFNSIDVFVGRLTAYPTPTNRERGWKKCDLCGHHSVLSIKFGYYRNGNTVHTSIISISSANGLCYNADAVMFQLSESFCLLSSHRPSSIRAHHILIAQTHTQIHYSFGKPENYAFSCSLSSSI